MKRTIIQTILYLFVSLIVIIQQRVVKTYSKDQQALELIRRVSEIVSLRFFNDFSKLNKLLVLFFTFLLAGCTATQTPSAIFDASQYDPLFVGFEDIDVVPQADIFHLNQNSKAYIQQRSRLAEKTGDKALTLINELFSPSQLALDYVHGANTVAQQTFDSGKANCLSLTILAYAMAQEAGLDVTFQEVFQQESWSQLGDFDLANGHVNLKISAKTRNSSLQGMPSQKRSYTVDFFPTAREGRYKTRSIDKGTIISFFYSNLAAQALVKGENRVAYANIRRSLSINPNDSSTWNNLALLLRRAGEPESAIKAWEQAIELKPDNYSAWENLANAYTMQGDEQQAKAITARLDRQRSDNPNYFIRIGNRHLVEGETDLAAKAFKQSIKLQRKNHFAWYGLARVSSLQGDRKGVERNLKKAKEYADTSGFALRYRNKLDAVTSQRN